MSELVAYEAVRDGLLDGDVLLFQARGPIAAVIRWAGRSSYSHAGLVARIRGRVFCAESRERKGCRLVPLSSVLSCSRRVDLFRPNGQADDEQRSAVVVEALEHLGQPYGWWQILRAALSHLPLVSLFVPGASYSEDDRRPTGSRLTCSAFVARCWRLAGLDLVPRLADGSTEPGDLARSSSLEYAGELKHRPPPAEE